MKYIALLCVFMPLALGGCMSTMGMATLGAEGAIFYATKPDSLPPADTEHQIPAHESWCYRTMGEVQCYAKAQDVHPERLINVEPQNRYPLTPKDYQDEVAGRRHLPPATDEPIELNNGNAVTAPPAPVSVEQAAPSTEKATPMATKKKTTAKKTTAKKAATKCCRCGCKSKKK